MLLFACWLLALTFRWGKFGSTGRAMPRSRLTRPCVFEKFGAAGMARPRLFTVQYSSLAEPGPQYQLGLSPLGSRASGTCKACNEAWLKGGVAGVPVGLADSPGNVSDRSALVSSRPKQSCLRPCRRSACFALKITGAWGYTWLDNFFWCMPLCISHP